MKNKSLAAQFRRTLILIVTASIAATVLTYMLAFYFFTRSRDIYPPNYYAGQIDGIEDYIREENMALLSWGREEGLKSMIRGEGMLYQVVDEKGNILYGTISGKPFESEDELINNFLNTTVFRQGYYIYSVPVMDNQGEFAGAVLLSYQIKTTVANERGWLVLAAVTAALFSPFLYITGFTLLFSNIYARKINEPLQLLTDASKKITEKDLDFEIDYHSDNELGRLCKAFSEMKEELKNSLSAQWKMEQEHTDMLEALAHDLKSPLSIILGYTDALIENNSGGSEKLCRYLAVIKENTERSTALVRQMQYTSHLEKADMQLHLTLVNLPHFLENKVRHYELQAKQKEIEITLNIQGDLGCPVILDVDKLDRILDNIVGNSIQFTWKGGRIEISVKTKKQRICYEIHDSGPGFTEKEKKKAFDKFYRGDEARQTQGGHSGLGLYIVKQLAEQLGGDILITDHQSGGACVIFWHKMFGTDGETFPLGDALSVYQYPSGTENF